MRMIPIFLAGWMALACSSTWAIDLPKVSDIEGLTKGSLLDKLNKNLADQQAKDGQFEFKTGKAQFASGNRSHG